MIPSFVINLEFCEDRLEAFQKSWPENDVIERPIRWPAVHGDSCPPPECWTAGSGAWGCYRSHQNLIEHALQNRITALAVFEDDAHFVKDFAEKVSRFINHLPSEWQLAYLGGDLMHAYEHPPEPVNSHVLRPFNVNRTHAMLYGRAGMVPVYQHISNLPYEKEYHIDHHLGRWHEDARNKVYCPNEWLVGQHGYASNVSGLTEDPTFFDSPISKVVSHKLYLTPVCVVYRASPTLIHGCRKFLHFGNSINNEGVDLTLAEASRLRNPSRAINGWFTWIRGEIARNGSGRLPALYAPAITMEEIQIALPGVKLIVVEHAATVEEIQKCINL